ncbi:uncharacterized protein LOC133031000 [Cannabis sativa]|uniref:uncharacterized protein LOC133031000 n=1 Tax=Cannabis sativa TaxID=3483 RepID=UPI0029C9CACE|nr:uncharacterized protein LOC133031000 [Cannabis sativa]
MAEIRSDSKSVVVSDVVPVMSKITDHKLIGSNYLEWSKTIRLYLRSIDKDDHLTDDPPEETNDSRKIWLREDARLFLQIRNSIDNEVISLINHCELVKELMGYLEFLYSGKDNISRIYDVCKAFYRAEKQDKSLMNYFMAFKKTYEELNVLLPFSPDVKVQQRQREQMAIMSFLAGLSSEFDSAKSQVLSSSDVSSLQDVFTRVLRTETTSSTPLNSALVSRNNSAPERNSTPSGFKGGNSQGPDNRTPNSGSIMCNYCKKPGHTKFECRKLQFKNRHNTLPILQALVMHLTNRSLFLLMNLPSSQGIRKHLSLHLLLSLRLLIQDLMTKKIIGKGHESGGLYVLDPLPPTSIACSSVASAFEAHCRLGHPSLPLLKLVSPI